MLPGRAVEIVAHLTDDAFAPKGHDQITTPFFFNGFSAPAPPPGVPKGEGITVISWIAFILSHKATFYYHCRGDEGTDNNPVWPLPKRNHPVCTLWGSTCSCSPSVASCSPIQGCTLTRVAPLRTHWRRFYRQDWRLSNHIVSNRWACICAGRCLVVLQTL